MSDVPVTTPQLTAEDHLAGIRMVLVEECRLVREALASMLEDSGWITAVVAVASCVDLEIICADDLPDVVLIGTIEDPADRLRLVRERFPGLPFIAMAVGSCDDELIRAAQAGFSGFLARAADRTALRDAVQRVLRGEVVCTPDMTAALLRRMTAMSPPAAAVPAPYLTNREYEVLRLIERGWSNKQIATELCIELRTVKNHVHRLLEKLQVSRRGEAAARFRSRVAAAEWNLADGNLKAARRGLVEKPLPRYPTPAC